MGPSLEDDGYAALWILVIDGNLSVATSVQVVESTVTEALLTRLPFLVSYLLSRLVS